MRWLSSLLRRPNPGLARGRRPARRVPRPRPSLLGLERLESRDLPSVNVLTYHNDIGRTGLNSNETILTPSNVNSNQFGLLFNLSVDGKVDAEPLYVSGVNIPNQGTHNVVFVATEHDSLYAFDADTGTLLWHDAYTGTPTTVLPAGEVPSDPVFGSQVTPEIGITSTPVIDPSSNTIYVVAMSKDANGDGVYHQRIEAFDITTGNLIGRTAVTATYGSQTFDPHQYKDRDALLLLNGVVYISFASHSDHDPYTGWLMGYNASTLQQVSVLDTDPAGPNDEGSYWNSGNGWGSDGTNLYNLSGNGAFDTTLRL
jgi:outer membrane protein assembly factor BamB